MKFLNETDRELKFRLAGKAYEVAIGAEVVVPDELGYAVKAMKLPLTCTERPVEAPRGEAVEGPDLLKARLRQERTRAASAEAQVKRLNDELTEARVQHRKVLDEQAKTEADLRGQLASFREDIKSLEQQLLAVTKDRDDLLEAATRADGEKKPGGKSGAAGKPS